MGRPGDTKEDQRGQDRSRPSIALLLDIDSEFRRKAEAGCLPLLKLSGKRTRRVPVLRIERDQWRLRARSKENLDQVIVYCSHLHRASAERAIITTAKIGGFRGKRVVRGRRAESARHHRGLLPATSSLVSWNSAAGGVAVLGLLAVLGIAGLTIFGEPDDAAHIMAPKPPKKSQSEVAGVTSVSVRPDENARHRADTINTRSEYPLDIAIGRNRLTEPSDTSKLLDQYYARLRKTFAAIKANEADKNSPAKVNVTSNTPVTSESEPISWRGGLSPVAAKASKQTNNDRSALSTQRGPSYAVTLPMPTPVPYRRLSVTRQKKEPLVALIASFQEDRKSNPGLHFNPEEHDSYWDMDVKSSLAGGSLVATGKLAFSSFDPYAQDRLEDNDHRAIAMQLKGSRKDFGYGASYRSAGKDFKPLKKDKTRLKQDREGWMMWGSRKIGKVALSTTYLEEQSNLEDEPKKPGFTDQEARVSFKHTLSKWPYFGYSLSYGSGTRKSSREPDGYAAYRGPIERIGGSLYYSADHWSASWNSYYLQARDTLARGRDSTILGHTLSASYSPTNNFGVYPSLTVTDEFYESDQSHTRGRYASLSLYRTFDKGRINLNANTSYYSGENITWNWDAEGIYAASGLSWALSDPQSNPKTVGLYLTYNQYADHIYDNSSTEDIAAWLIFRTNRERPTFASPRRARIEGKLDY